AAARASRDACSDLMQVSNAPAADALSPIISALALARMPQPFLMSMLGRLLSFAMAANVVKTTTAAERAIVGFGIMFSAISANACVVWTRAIRPIDNDAAN